MLGVVRHGMFGQGRDIRVRLGKARRKSAVPGAVRYGRDIEVR